jgi:membrane-bound ClpP family serine protease
VTAPSACASRTAACGSRRRPDDPAEEPEKPSARALYTRPKEVDVTTLIVALLVLGPGLLVAEAHLPTYGVLGAAGIGALGAGIVLAVLESGGSIALALALTVPLVVAATALGAVAMRKALAASRQRARCGADGLIGHVGVVRRPLDPLGQIMVDGELWRARRSWAEEDEPPPAAGEQVVIDRVEGLTLSVRRAELWEVER